MDPAAGYGTNVMMPEASYFTKESNSVPMSDCSLSVHNATWFLDLLETSNMEELAPEDREKMLESKLRAKPKHRSAILFQDDADFVLRREHDLVVDAEKIQGSGSFDARVWLIREACRRVIVAYETSIQNAPLRSCVWSALMHRAEYHLRMSGHTDVRIIENNNSMKEATLCLQGHQISRSNFTKIARQFCEDSAKRQKEYE